MFYYGQRYFKRNYKLGEKHGEWVWWYDNGQKKYLGSYSNDKKNGKWLEWSQSGDLIINGNYKFGKKWEGTFKNGSYSSGRKQDS